MAPWAGRTGCYKQAPFHLTSIASGLAGAWWASMGSWGKGNRLGTRFCVTCPPGCRPNGILWAPGLCPGGSPKPELLPTFPYSRAHRAESICLQSRDEAPQLRFPVVASRTSTSELPKTQFTLKWEDFPDWRASALLTPVRTEVEAANQHSADPRDPTRSHKLGLHHSQTASGQMGGGGRLHSHRMAQPQVPVGTFNPWLGYRFSSA